MNDVYVAKKDCGHIVAAVPANSRKETADIVQRLIVSGYRIELSSSHEVAFMFNLHCDCGRAPMLPGIDGEAPAENSDIIHDDGADQADVDALSEEPQTEEAEAALEELVELEELEETEVIQ